MSIAFKKPSLDEVISLIQKELKDIPLESLSIRVGSDSEISPIYNDTNKSIKIPYLLDYKVIFQLFTLSPSLSEYNNQTLLQALENGQNGLILDFQNKTWTTHEISQLFLNIRLDYIHTEFLNLSDSTQKIIQDFIGNYNPALAWHNYALGHQVYCIPVDNFYAAAAHCIQNLQEPKAFIHIELSGDYFLDIARIRAFKTLLFHHRTLDGLEPHFLLLGETSLKNKSSDDTENNLLKLTTEAMAAMIGGCEGIWIRPHNQDYSSPVGQRLARNIFHLMQEEAYLHLVEDISGGSYFIEHYTETVAQEIYKLFK